VKVLLSTPNLVEISAAKLALDNNGIQSQIFNESTYQNIPGPFAYPELWVFDDSDFQRAAEIVKAARPSAAPPPQGDWICAKCGEKSEAQFVSCWNCGVARPGV